jgi:hypothetical protein
MEGINAKVRENLAKIDAERNAEELKVQYHEMTRSLDKVRADRLRLLADVKMPLAGLEISEDGTLLYNGREWDGCSGMEQMRIAVAICASIKPECGFVLLDGLERMDTRQLAEFAEWLDERGLQAIGTRVSEGEECSIIIEDGVAVAAPSERLLHGMLVGGSVRLCGECYPLAMLAAAGSGSTKERTAALFMVLPSPLSVTGADVTMALTMEPEALHLQLNKEHRLCDLWVTFFAAGHKRLVQEG